MLVKQTSDQSVDVLTAAIALNATTSDAVILYGCTPSFFQIPAAFVGTTVTFLGSVDMGSTFKEIRDKTGAAISYTVAVNGLYTMAEDTFKGLDQIKFVTASQTGGAVSILLKPFLS